MGHLVGKDLYRQLGNKIDNLTARAPWSDTLHAILRELYSPEEAEVAVRMPYGLSTFDTLQRVTRLEAARLREILERLCAKGLVMDLRIGDRDHYTLSPIVIGIFEFSMMRTGDRLPTREWARLFHDYFEEPGTFYDANFGKGQQVFPLRALPWEETIDQSDFVEVLDYEKASAIIEESKHFAIGLCSCRHEKHHLGRKTCDTPLETCSTMGDSVEFMVRHGFARSVSKSEMKDNLARSRELGLVLSADNVKRDISFICHCCGCCCNILLGVSRFGYPNALVTSNFIATVDHETCAQCGTCAERCPIHAIAHEDGGQPEVDEAICLGCGVCGLACPTGSVTLTRRPQRVLHPETTFERIILQSLERGRLQNFLFPQPDRVSHRILRAFVGAFLKIPPVQQALMADTLRSSFLGFLQRGAHRGSEA